jgi:hypothetical protein
MNPNMNGMQPMNNMNPNMNGMQPMGNMNPNMYGMQPMGSMNPNMNGMQPMNNMNPNMNGMQQMNNMNSNMNGMQPMNNMNPNMYGMQPMGNMNPNMNGMQPMGNMNPNMNGMQQMNNMNPNMNGMQPMGNMNPNMNGMQQMNNMNPNMYGMQQMNNMNPNMNGMQQMNNMNSNMNGMQPMNNMQQNVNTTPKKIAESSQQLDTSINEEDILKAYIGKNNDKIMYGSFNFAGFFFGVLYMFYRKMFLYALLVSIASIVVLNLVNMPFISLGFNLLIGFMVNKIYVSYVKKNIEKIRTKNPGIRDEELLNLCIKKGGTSFGKVILGILAEIGLAFVLSFVFVLFGVGATFLKGNIDFNFNKSNSSSVTEKDDNKNQISDEVELKNVEINGCGCVGNKCTITLGDSEEYELNSNTHLLSDLWDYRDYIILDVKYAKINGTNTITDYTIYLKSDNKKLENVKTEDELRTEIGLYAVGTHTASFKYIEQIPYISDNNCKDYKFISDKNIEFDMLYCKNDSLNLSKDKTYSITFEYIDDFPFSRYEIKSIK